MSNMTREQVDTLVEHWNSKASGAEQLHPNLPLATLVLEGFELANFIEHYWEPKAELGLPGLKEYVRAQFTKSLASEIRELALAVAELQGRYNAEVEPPIEAPVERGEEILGELHRALTFLFDDGVDAIEDKELAKVKKEFNDRNSHNALAQSLDGTAYYANEHRKRLKAIPNFDVAIVDEALVVARRLREHNALKESAALARSSRDARARVTRLLHDRMNIARRTIRYAFADKPEVVQRATSQYRRERRQKWREKRRGETDDAQG